MLLTLFVTIFSIFCSKASAQPGASWTEEEALIVKAKLYAIFQQSLKVSNEYLSLHPELGIKEWPETATRPNAPKFLRLGFHQCLKFSDGTGGCNGCLNNHGMGLENRHQCVDEDGVDNTKYGQDPNTNMLKTNNAGLEHTADILEEIFINKDFPSTAVALEESLADSGKSRADLWTFASTVAVEWGVDRNNNGCDGSDTFGDLTKGCKHLRAKEADCKIEGKESLKFLTGRSDCASEAGLKSWETTKEEHHPSPHGNGVMTADFFKQDFGLTGREGAALLLGAHSFGTFNYVVSQYKYDWTRKQSSMLNNQVIRHVAMKPQYFHECRDEDPFVGDYLGQPAVTRWKVVAHQCATGMGPFQWFHQYYRCPASNSCSGLRPNETVTTRTPLHEYPSLSNFDNENPKDVLMNRAEPNTPDRCCDDLPSGQYCKENCVKRIQNDETALSVDVGYYLDFEIDPVTGRPDGCDCFSDAYRYPNWTNSKVVDCPKQKYAPEGEKLHKIIDEFADNQNKWIKEFLSALDKMSKNGNENLVEGPTTWYGARCNSIKVAGKG